MYTEVEIWTNQPSLSGDNHQYSFAIVLLLKLFELLVVNLILQISILITLIN